MYENVDAVVATPIYSFWYELSIAFPEAKVIFYEREIDSWSLSRAKQVVATSELTILPDVVRRSIYYFLAPNSYKIEVNNSLANKMTLGYFDNFKSIFLENFQPNLFYMKRAYRQHNTDVINKGQPQKRKLV